MKQIYINPCDAEKRFPAFVRRLEEEGTGGLSFRRFCFGCSVLPVFMNCYLVSHFGLTGEEVLDLYRQK